MKKGVIIQVIAAIGIFLLLIAAFLGTFLHGTPFSSQSILDLIWLATTLLVLVFGLLNIPAREMLKRQNFLFYGLSAFTIGLALFAIAVDNLGLAAFTGVVVIALIAGKVGTLIWTSALLPALKAIPAAFSGYYLKKWLDERGKKKSTPETALPEPSPTVTPANPAPVKSTRKRATPPHPRANEPT